MCNNKEIANKLILKRKRGYSKRKKIISKRTQQPLMSINGWMLCLYLLLLYINKKKDTECHNNNYKNNSSTNDNHSHKKSYIPPLSFKKLWTEELVKNKYLQIKIR